MYENTGRVQGAYEPCPFLTNRERGACVTGPGLEEARKDIDFIASCMGCLNDGTRIILDTVVKD